MSELADGRATPAALEEWTGAAISSVHNALERLQAAGHVEEKVDTLANREQESNAPFFVKWFRWYQQRE